MGINAEACLGKEGTAQVPQMDYLELRESGTEVGNGDFATENTEVQSEFTETIHKLLFSRFGSGLRDLCVGAP